MRKRQSQQERKQQTRRQLLETAAEVFIELGYSGASIDIIADRAGYTKGAVYGHFKNKEELFFAVFTIRAEAQFKILQENIASKQLLEKVVDTTEQKKAGGFSHDNKQWILLVLEYLLYAQRNPNALTSLQDFFKNNRELIKKIFAKRLSLEGDKDDDKLDQLSLKQQIIDMGFVVLYLIDNSISLDIYKQLMMDVFNGSNLS